MTIINYFETFCEFDAVDVLKSVTFKYFSKKKTCTVYVNYCPYTLLFTFPNIYHKRLSYFLITCNFESKVAGDDKCGRS